GQFLAECENVTRMASVAFNPSASTLLFLPLAHVLARVIQTAALTARVKLGHCSDTKKIVEELAGFKPTFILSVPRVFEKVYNSASQKAHADGKGPIFDKAAATAIAWSRATYAGKVPLGLKVKHAVFDKLVYAKLRAAIGGRVQYAISGSAPLSPRLSHFFRSIGVLILEGYGLTETTAPATVNLVKRSKIGTVGLPLPGVAVRTADDGEIQVKGVCVFKEYWKNPQATSAVFDDGWFATGDLGSFDDEGFLTITGRKKEIIVTAGGKNVAPAMLEDPVRANPLVSQVIVVGDQKPFIAALVTLDAEMLPVWLQNNGLDRTMSVQQAAEDPGVLAEIQRAIDEANSHVSRAESIRKFVVLPTDLSEASGHLTPKLSIKRKVILDDFADVIEGMYTASPAPATEGFSLH
ncbi:MAG TPA: AMP-dependent synthetase/ligase, partial [Humibacter sp.]|nr:AMP-dependent synthetase/ligase [Humibacter sp.]